ncbi:pyridoxamine 5'-phosphate oxidase [Sphingomonas sp. BN140010]|uniref:Pyridoxine/pyridoxamine 5'-phosphate oxidase n=1 Tax=Sphingomonas arvum TaxID=2992113 RepID=A0ABT3JGF4_9SPHN|nr:pyridoxamine 5'-phosphate oxidase [Sphingomonas sp. BN140010]MCW3798173.1 pyridoxamine 5'-phosphate oxidase [Sphingomonas sp. BN140010]
MTDDPFALFEEWFAEAQRSEPNDPDAMALATSTPDGRPSVRIVLMRLHGPEGFGFFTNLQSRKGQEIAANQAAALCIHWKSLRKQVRAEGVLQSVSTADADAYFASRSRDSRIGAWASDQSRPLDARETFLGRIEEATARFGDDDVPRPPHWSGFRLVPERIEFWEDREFRLHHRRLFTRQPHGGWSEGLLYP